MTTRTDRNQTFDADGNLLSEEIVEVEVDDTITPDERIASLEAKLAAVEALATKANATAQEVARAAKDAKPTR